MFCPSCGKESPEGSQQCVNCGAQLAEVGGYSQPPQYGSSVKTSGLAIAALVMGICSIFCGCLLAIPSLIMGIVALGRIGRSGGAIQGKGLATGAIVTASIGMVFSVLILPAILFPVFARARETARKSTCQANMHQCGIAFQMYCQDYDETLPSSAVGAGNTPTIFITGSGTTAPMGSVTDKLSWGQIIYDYLQNKDALFCPSDSSSAGSYTSLSYWWKTAANDAWLGVNSTTPCRRRGDFAYEADQIILYEHSGFHSGDACLKDGVMINVVFVDSHVKPVILTSTTNSAATTYPTTADVTAPEAAGEPMYYNYDATMGTALPVGRNADATNYCDKF